MELFKVRAQSPSDEAADLYLKVRSGTVGFENGSCVLSPGSEISTDVYFNIFSSSKYGEYTVAEEISIATSVSGRLDIELRSCSDLGEEVLDVRRVDSEGPEEVDFSFKIKNLDDSRPVCHYLLYRAHDRSTVHSFGSYVSDIEPDEVDLGIVICTFNREERVLRNVERINSLISDPTCGPVGKSTVYVIDNGRTLDKDSVDYDSVKLIPNKNNGGSGGFSKGIIESRRDNKTHILLMDDDIEIDPNVIYKTFNLISILNDRHKGAFILGGMLLPESPRIQYEAGAEYLPEFKRGKHMLDLSDAGALLRNDKGEKADYGGWWFMAMPSSAADQLPLPLFIKLDDVEFGIRRMRDHIVMNGIGIWHDSFESKANPITDFYFLRRNLLILYSLYDVHNGMQIGIAHLRNMLKCMKHGNIREYVFTRRAVDDYLKGPEFIANVDQENLIKSCNPHMDENGSSEKPEKKRRIVYRNNMRKFSFRCLLYLLPESFNVAIRWNKLSRSYRDSMEYLTSMEYWESKQ
jgi:GT2 family glycosyltransferase